MVLSTHVAANNLLKCLQMIHCPLLDCGKALFTRGAQTHIQDKYSYTQDKCRSILKLHVKYQMSLM